MMGRRAPRSPRACLGHQSHHLPQVTEEDASLREVTEGRAGWDPSLSVPQPLPGPGSPLPRGCLLQVSRGLWQL